MYALKVNLKDAEKAKLFLLDNNLLDHNKINKKIDNYILFPLTKNNFNIKIDFDYEIISIILDDKLIKQNAKEKLYSILEKEDLSHLKTALDIIGDIAIIEIDDNLKDKEKIIAQAILDTHKNIKTVVKKSGIHSGEFRTQKTIHLLGEKKKISLYKENNCKLKVDVDNVYFSPRLSTERKRIMEQIKTNENILVMFSGVAPYPIVLSKNSVASNIIGIELNPDAFNLGKENLKLNKINNVTLINGDVKNIINNLINQKIGLKSHFFDIQLKSRLEKNPNLIEIHLNDGDLLGNLEELEHQINLLKSKKIDIYLHAPLIHKGFEINFCSDNELVIENSINLCNILENLCDKYDLKGFIFHPYSFEKSVLKQKTTLEYENSNLIFEKTLSHINFKHMYIENMPFGFFNNLDYVLKIVNKYNLKLCLDIAHLYLSDKNNFYDNIIKISNLNNDIYWHISDSNGIYEIGDESHALEINKGKIDFKKVLPYINKGIIEVKNQDENDPIEMLNSYDQIIDLKLFLTNYDRILMPLPKTADDFLDFALNVSKKNTIIHFYDFLREDNFHEAHEKIKEACIRNNKKFEILSTNKCGQHAPYTFRICVDFIILD